MHTLIKATPPSNTDRRITMTFSEGAVLLFGLFMILAGLGMFLPKVFVALGGLLIGLGVGLLVGAVATLVILASCGLGEQLQALIPGFTFKKNPPAADAAEGETRL